MTAVETVAARAAEYHGFFAVLIVGVLAYIAYAWFVPMVSKKRKNKPQSDAKNNQAL